MPGLLIAALLVRLLFVVMGPFFIRPDEIFQALEPAHRLLTGHGAITWEWQAGIRSWLLPGFIAGVMQVAAWAGLGHSILAVQCVLALLSLAVVAIAIRFGERFGGGRGALFCGTLAAFSPDTVLYGAHSLSESQGGNLLAIAVMLAAIDIDRPGATRRAAFVTGLMLGLAVMLRFQLAPGAAVVLLIALRADPRGRGPILWLGAALPVAAQALLDALTLGSPLQSIWKNLELNLVEHRADLYGTMSPAFYLGQMVQFWGAALLPLTVCFVAGIRTAMLPSVVVLAVIGSHSLIAHKEPSFIYAAIPLILVVAGLGAARLWPTAPPERVAAVMALACLFTLVSGYKPMRRDHLAITALVREAAATRGLCGVALYDAGNDWWMWSGGQSLLDRPVPVFLPRTPADLAAAAPGFDVLIADEAMVPGLPAGYAVARCLHGVCVLRRPGPCGPTRFRTIEAEPGLGLPVPIPATGAP